MVVVVVGSPDIMPFNNTHLYAQIKMLDTLNKIILVYIILVFKLLTFKSNLSIVRDEMKILTTYQSLKLKPFNKSYT